MSKEAMTLALEALEYIEHNYMSLPAPAEKAIAALRQALSNEALDKMAKNAREIGLDYEPAQQKPKRWAVFCQGCRKEWSVSYPHPGKSICADCDDKLAQYDASPQPAQQEPVANKVLADAYQCGFHAGRKSAEILPPSKPWVGLTHDEIKAAYLAVSEIEWAICGMDDAVPFTRIIEAKLKEKNT